MTEIVSLYRCKKCTIRMFERDCRGHLIRCQGIVLAEPKNILKYFARGEPDQHSRPGGNWKPMQQPTRGRRKGVKKAVGAKSDDETEAEETEFD